jgi:hypothetical protein
MLDVGRMKWVPAELLSFADEIRDSLVDLPERVIRRRVRDLVDAAKAIIGPLAAGGVKAMEASLKTDLLRRARDQSRTQGL